MGTFRAVDDHQDGYLRIIHRRHADERAVVIVAVFAASRVDLVRGTGLTADTIAGDARVAAAALIDDVLHDAAHLFRRLGGNDFAHRYRFIFFDNFSVFIRQCLDIMWLQQNAVVADRVDCAQQLDRGHGNTLPVADGRQFDRTDVFERVHDGSGFARVIHAGLFGDAVQAQIFIEGGLAHERRDFGQRRVAGIADGLADGLGTVAAVCPAVQPYACNSKAACAVERRIGVDDFFF